MRVHSDTRIGEALVLGEKEKSINTDGATHGTSPEHRSGDANEQVAGQEAGRGDGTSQTHREAHVSPA